ncbi:sugar transferase [Ekhidna sp.]|uniref:sugar transferase n=1 Tax=Ekhidna sp. TaxID=2608089 RepID=UPI003BA8BE5D
MVRDNFYVKYAKPVGDWIVSFILVLILSPLMVIIGLLLYLHFKKSPIFVQNRPGKKSQVFGLLKFRTMQTDYDEQSTTNFGKFLRSSSLDELPQLINVLKNEMSLIGPRPLLIEYLSHYNEREILRQNVRPGITGWAQVNGRNSISWAQRMELDIFYAQHASLLLDLKIIIMTISQLFKRDMTTYQNDETIKFSDYASKR